MTGVWRWKGTLHLAFSGRSRTKQTCFAFYLLFCPAADFASFCAQDPLHHLCEWYLGPFGRKSLVMLKNNLQTKLGLFKKRSLMIADTRVDEDGDGIFNRQERLAPNLQDKADRVMGQIKRRLNQGREERDAKRLALAVSGGTLTLQEAKVVVSGQKPLTAIKGQVKARTISKQDRCRERHFARSAARPRCQRRQRGMEISTRW